MINLQKNLAVLFLCSHSLFAYIMTGNPKFLGRHLYVPVIDPKRPGLFWNIHGAGWSNQDTLFFGLIQPQFLPKSIKHGFK